MKQDGIRSGAWLARSTYLNTMPALVAASQWSRVVSMIINEERRKEMLQNWEKETKRLGPGGNWRRLGCHPEEGGCHVYAGRRRKWSGPAEHE